MLQGQKITILSLFKQFYIRMSVTWGLVLLETFLLAMIPLLIGYTIDDLLAGDYESIIHLSLVLFFLITTAVGRRIYDTRAYGAIKVHMGIAVNDRHPETETSSRNARLDMSYELILFLEEQIPYIITSIVQIIVSVVVLYSFHQNLALSALCAAIGMIVTYGLFHRKFYNLNSTLNSQVEKQVTILEKRNRLGLLQHLKALRSVEVKLSDTEAIVYGLIFLLQFGFIIFNLWQSTTIDAVTAGMIFSIVTYSWEYVEAAIMLPVTLQQWTRLHEITERINNLKD